MAFSLLLFYLFALVLIGAALAVVSVRNSVHAALFLVLAFFTSAGIWLLLHAEFLAITLVLVYVGAVMVLFLFVVMMLDVKAQPVKHSGQQYLPVAIGVALLMLAEVIALVGVGELDDGGGIQDGAAIAGLSNIEWLGHALFSDYILPFEIAAVILTVAIIAAVALTLRHRPNVRTQSAPAQSAVSASERVRLVNLPSSTAKGQTP
ncbi:MAG: NADH:ubiquinone oxidoreductase subunit J [Lysobacterales bacterium CG_4_9_14_3_um_filter_62_6]|nr:MAG: NADH:ubiquinone oxidoreductase subunit J [Xanthomonadales bacterium CG_4_9_14_3_um_filter_62_6]